MPYIRQIIVFISPYRICILHVGLLFLITFDFSSCYCCNVVVGGFFFSSVVIIYSKCVCVCVLLRLLILVLLAFGATATVAVAIVVACVVISSAVCIVWILAFCFMPHSFTFVIFGMMSFQFIYHLHSSPHSPPYSHSRSHSYSYSYSHCHFIWFHFVLIWDFQFAKTAYDDEWRNCCWLF